MNPTEQPTWRDYSLHQYGDGDSDVSVLCRSDSGCEDNQPNAHGRYLTLGEAVDWAQKHAADHAKWDAEVAADELAHQDNESLFESHRLADGTMPNTIPVTDSEQDAPDGATVDGYTRHRDAWVKTTAPAAG